jgi:hypothetical protein
MVAGTLHTVDDLLAPFTAPVAAPALVSTPVAARHEHDATFWWHQPEWAQLVCCGSH